MALFFLQSLFIAPVLVAAQTALNPTVVCLPGQCLQGFSNLTLGAKLSSPASPVPIHLLPGQYSSTTNPQLLHDALTSSSSTVTSSAGFSNSSLSLPLDLSLQPGLAVFSDRLYSGQTSFTALPNSPPNPNTSTPLSANSLALSSNVVVIATSSANRIVLWDPVPDTNQLPSSLSSAQLSLVDIQVTTCSPSCSSGGICSAQGQCVCQDGFTGPLCESCAPGHFGPTCQKCEDGCDQCDDGISGTGRCLKKSGGGNTCNCLNGVCGSDGNCQCNAGFTKADNGTQCAKCADGFFQTPTGDCKVCQVGCTQCASGNGACLACKPGFSQDPKDTTKCVPLNQVTSTGFQCPEPGFANGTSVCSVCASPCQSCSGGSLNDCTACVRGQYMLNGVCVTANSDGVCSGSNLIADNEKKACDSCGAKCTSCKIPNFTTVSFVSQLQCTGCIPGSFLSNSTCVDSCPSGTFVSPQDNMTCIPCDSSCSTCSDSATFCLTCSGQNQLTFNGKCVAASSCPKTTFADPSTSSCLSCHPDCATCSGTSFNQCTACPPDRPVLSNGRCMPTCLKNEYWDSSANACKNCDSSCGSCFGPGSSGCLSCSNANDRVLRSGSCVAASGACPSSNITTVINPLGVCLSEVVTVPTASETGTLPPMPSVTGINQPTMTVKGRRLEWWEILLMALGCAFIFLVVIWCCRRRSRKRKEAEKRRVQAYAFANTHTGAKTSWWKCAGKRDKSVPAYHPDLDNDEVIHTRPLHKEKSDWRWRLVRFGEKLFGHSKSTRVYPDSPRHSIEMSPSARGKTIVAISHPTSSSRDIKHQYQHSHSYSHSHSHSHSRSYSEDSFRDVDLERATSPHPRSLSPPHPQRPFRPSRSSDEHSLDLIDLDQRRPRRPRREAEEQGTGEEQDMIEFISSYRYTQHKPKTPPFSKPNFLHHGSRSGSRSNTPTPSNSSRTHLLAPRAMGRSREPSRERGGGGGESEWDYDLEDYNRHSRSSISTDSMYSQATGHTRRLPDVRQPVRDDSVPPVPVLKSKFSMSTIGVGDDSSNDRRGLIGYGKLKKKPGSGSFWK